MDVGEISVGVDTRGRLVGCSREGQIFDIVVVAVRRTEAERKATRVRGRANVSACPMAMRCLELAPACATCKATVWT